jgi:hypothetical protein
MTDLLSIDEKDDIMTPRKLFSIVINCMRGIIMA